MSTKTEQEVVDWVNTKVAANELLTFNIRGKQQDVIDYVDRKMVLGNINGQKIPFYLSTGQAGKKQVPAGKWYPFFGVGPDDWINKTSQSQIASYYNSPELKRFAEELDAGIGDIRNWGVGPEAEIGYLDNAHKIVGDASGFYGVENNSAAYGKLNKIIKDVTTRLSGAHSAPAPPPVVPPAPPPVVPPAPPGDFKSRILSFDIETSSLDPHDGFVWQSGFASYNENDIQKSGLFFDPDNSTNREAALRGSSFGEKQFQAGAFTEYLASSNNKSQAGFITSVVDKLIEEHKNGRDILLIQNANFERRWLEAVSESSDSSTEDFKRLNAIMHHSYSVNNSPSLHPSPKIMELRNAALGNYYDFLKTGNTQGFDIAASAYKDIMSEYKSYFSTNNGKLKIIDMMDVTRGLLFKLAEEGYIDKNMSLIGTSQSFLSSIFLDRPEKHLAPDDAGDALEIFSRHLFSMYDEVSSGNISHSSKLLIAKLKSGQSKEARNQFIKSMIRAVDEGSSTGGYRYTGKIGTESSGKIDFIDNETGTRHTTNRTFRNGLFTLRTESDLDLILSDVAERYNSVTFDKYDAQTILASIMNKGTNKEKIEYLKSLEDTVSIPIQEQEVDYRNAWSYIKQNKIKATIGIGSAIGVTAMIVSGDTTDSKAQRKYSEQEKYLESNIKMYNTIPQYHGSGFADWNERTKHHYY